MENITINDILYVLITVALPLVLRYAYQLVSVKVAGTQYANAVNAVFSAVDYVNQTFVDSLKEAGNFDTAAQAVALRKAKDAALETMEAGTRKWLEKSYADLDSWLTVQIESAVKSAKVTV